MSGFHLFIPPVLTVSVIYWMVCWGEKKIKKALLRLPDRQSSCVRLIGFSARINSPTLALCLNTVRLISGFCSLIDVGYGITYSSYASVLTQSERAEGKHSRGGGYGLCPRVKGRV